MRLGTLCVLAMLAGASWGTHVRADDGPAGGSWLGRWLSFGKQSNQKTVDEAPVPVPLPRPALSQQAQAEAAFHRRSEVCLKLRRIAIDTNDTALQLEVERLEQEIWQHFSRQTSKGGQP